MNTPFSLMRRITLAVGCVAGLALIAIPATQANEAPAHNAEAKALPVTTSIHKGTPGEHGGPFVLAVKNTGTSALKVTATIVQSVTNHSKPATIEKPAHEIAAGGTYEVADLAVDDAVTLHADGYDKLVVKVPAAK